MKPFETFHTFQTFQTFHTFKDKLGSTRLEDSFKDFKSPLTEVEATTEANRCIQCFAAPCIQACPTEINIPQFINRIATGNALGAAKTILDSNILGHSCAVSCPTEVLCEGACVYHQLNQQPILIGKLQRYAVEHAYTQGAQFYTPGPPSGKTVALVGTGPASLACAHELRKHGHETILFEKSSLPGGLNTQGIAPYKMKAQTSLFEIEQIAKMGVQFKFNQELGRQFKLSDLTAQYDAVFLGMGLGPDRSFEGAPEHPRIFGAVELISKIKTAPASQLSWISTVSTALIIGGGNTSLDAARELKGLGIPRVLVSYRRGQSEMSGYLHEFKIARQEGIEFLFQSLPTEFQPLGPDLIRVDLQKNQIETNLIVIATGQSHLENLLSEDPSLSFHQGRLEVDPQTGRTGNPKIFAGGDLINGGMEVVNAVAEGKRAAQSIHEVLRHG